jgi:hypothetical protein
MENMRKAFSRNLHTALREHNRLQRIKNVSTLYQKRESQLAESIKTTMEILDKPGSSGRGKYKDGGPDPGLTVTSFFATTARSTGQLVVDFMKSFAQRTFLLGDRTLESLGNKTDAKGSFGLN